MKEILYVEDNIDIAKAVQIILGGVGFTVDTAYSGNEGISKAMSKSFDVIMLDIMLPDMTGWEVFHALKGKLVTKFIFVSAIPISEERMSELLNTGIHDYIMKPFLKNELINRINHIIIP